jgi:hypothetical protein
VSMDHFTVIDAILTNARRLSSIPAQSPTLAITLQLI